MTDQLNQNHSTFKSILIVDDEVAILQTLIRYLKRQWPNYKVMGVRNGRTAWRLLERRSFALLITDYDIPGMNGLHLAWRTRQYLPDLPIILMSGSAPADLQAEVKALNASFMAKPFSLARFEIEVKTLGL